MEVVRKMNMPAEVLFKNIMDSVLYDIQKQTGKRLTRQQLKNYSYEKEFSKNSKASMKIEQLDENQAYHFSTTTNKNDYLVKYDITSIDSNSCELYYTETMESYGTIQKINDMLTGILLSYFKKRRFKKMLELIEESYKKEKQKSVASQ